MANKTTAKERLMQTLSGNEPDRTPAYTLIPYAIEAGRFVPGAFHGYADIDDWRKQDPLYTELVERMETEGDNFFIWRPECMDAQNIFIHPDAVSPEPVRRDGKNITKRYHIDAGDRTLFRTEVFISGTGHSWITEHICKTIDDALALLEYDYRPAACDIDSFRENSDALGDRGLIWVTIPSPIMAACRLFDPQDFLLFSTIHRDEVIRLVETAYERIRENLVSLLEAGAGPIIRFGGAEHATPPLMSPDDFDRFVVEYDKPLMDLCKQYDRFVAVHCHGNIRHAVKRFIEMGVDQIDPVEATPHGDISLEEIREITADQITLTGNIQVSEMARESPEYITRRVKEIIRIAGPRRLVISTTGTPLEKLPPELYANYQALLDAVR